VEYVIGPDVVAVLVKRKGNAGWSVDLVDPNLKKIDLAD